MKKQLFTPEIFLIGAVILSVGCSPKIMQSPVPQKAGTYQATIEYARKLIDQKMKSMGVTGMAVAVVDSDKVIFSEGFGYEDKAAKKKVTPSSTFMIGSVTKLFTATAIMQLCEQGKIVLDSPVTTYLPEFTIKSRFQSRPITIRDLMIHESGIPSDYFKGFVVGQKYTSETQTAYRSVPALLSQEYMARPPRTSFAYCNLGFSLLGNVIERVSGVTYKQYITDSIFARIGMKESSAVLDSLSATKLSKGYLANKQVDPPFIRDISAGAVVSNVSDLSLFLQMLLQGGKLGERKVLRDSTLFSMWTPQNTDIPLDLNFRIGLPYWLNSPVPGTGRFAFHGGDIPPYHAFLAVMPDTKLGVVVLINSGVSGMVCPILGTLLMEAFYKAKTGKDLPVPPKKKSVILDPSTSTQLDGYYASGNGLTKVSGEGKSLSINLSGLPVSLLAHDDSSFSMEFKLLGLFPIAAEMFSHMQFDRRIIGKHNLLAFSVYSVPLDVMEKIEPDSIPALWKKRTGNYTLVDSIPDVFTSNIVKQMFITENAMLKLDKKSGFLCIEQRILGTTLRIPIKPVSDNDAVVYGVGRGSGETISAFTKDGKDYIRISGYTMRKVEKK